MAAQKSSCGPFCVTTIGSLLDALPFFTEEAIRQQFRRWHMLKNGLECSQDVHANHPIPTDQRLVVEYKHPRSRLQRQPVDLALRVEDATTHGILEAAILFELAVRTIIQGEWVMTYSPIVAEQNGDSGETFVEAVQSLKNRGQIEPHPNKLIWGKVTDPSRLELPEVRWFAAQRLAQRRLKAKRRGVVRPAPQMSP